MTTLFRYSTHDCPQHEPMLLFEYYLCRHCGQRMDAPPPKQTPEQQPRRGGVKPAWNKK